jgi:hypothetical protein
VPPPNSQFLDASFLRGLILIVAIVENCPAQFCARGRLTALEHCIQGAANDAGLPFLCVAYLAGFVNLFASKTDVFNVPIRNVDLSVSTM